MRVTSIAVAIVIQVIGLSFGSVSGSIVTAQLSANPAEILEGQSTTITFNLSNQSNAPGTVLSRLSGITFRGSKYLPGIGARPTFTAFHLISEGSYIDNFSGQLNPGNGQPNKSLYYPGNGNSYTNHQHINYISPGDFRATVSGTARVVENRSKSYDYFATNGGNPNDPDNIIHFLNRMSAGSYSPLTSQHNINASTDIKVNSLNPYIYDMQWDAVVYLDEPVSFTMRAYDPYGVGSTESLTFDYGFDGDGLFDDWSQTTGQSGVSSGSTSFTNPGTHRIDVRVSDGQGGYSTASFSVDVVEPAVAPIPEPTTFLVWAGLACCCSFAVKRRR